MENMGLDIIGFPRGKLGIGEQGRSLARVALAAGYQINFIDCYHSSDRIENDDREFEEYISEKFKYPLRIYSLTQPHIGALLYRFGVGFFLNRNNIFHLAWEFNQRPLALDACLRFADEIWGISTFTSSSFENNFSIPVQTMPNAVTRFDVSPVTRADFGLPEGSFLYYTFFDVNSTLTRKNPLANVRAFQQAFPETEDVGLLIKVSNVNANLPAWKELLALINGDRRVFLVDQGLTRKTLMGLFNCCDAYLSLHRSEGFGLGLIEAMLLEKPVVCTAYSGNMDFCSDDTAFLVDFNLVRVGATEYPYAEGFFWADPSISNAAKRMQEVYLGGDRVKQKTNAAVIGVEQFSVESLANKFCNLVEDFMVRHAGKRGSNEK